MEFSDEFARYLRAFTSSAFRLETLQVYNEDDEREEFQAFLAGRPPPVYPEWERWLAELPRMTAEGRQITRVHVVVEPLTDYLRYECAWGYRDSARAGEDIRIIALTGDEWPAGLPHRDFWLFDSAHLFDMTYGDDGALASVDLVDDPERIAQAVRWRERALTTAVPYAEFEQRFDELMHPR